VVRYLGKTSRGLAVTAAILAAIGLLTMSRPADAGWGGGGISPGAAAGIGLGAFALGTAVANPYFYSPYYSPYYYPYGSGYPTGYYPPAPYYPPARSCWNPYYRTYYAC
jgi:hypothetical protein